MTISVTIRRICIISMLLTLGSCTNLIAPLITPKVNATLAELKPGEYRLDPTHAALLFKVQHLGLSTYVGRFNEVDATLEFDPEDMASAKLTAVVTIDSLDINDEGLKQDLMGRNWFNQKSYPQAVFTTTRVVPIDQNRFEFTGELDWRGVKKPMVMTATFHGGANNILSGQYTLGFSAQGRFKRSSFNMGDLIPLIGDEVTIDVFAEFLRN